MRRPGRTAAARLALAGLLVALTVAMAADAAPRSRLDLTVRTLHVPAGGRTRTVVVYRPPVPETRALPVVYFLHGVPGSPDDAVRGGVVAAADRQARAGRPFVLAVPDGNGSRADTEWADDQSGTDQLASFVAGPLIAAVEGNARRAPDRRALMGFSMGGYGAANIALQHPGLYGGFAAVSGYFTVDDPDEVFGGNSAVERENSPDQLVAAWRGHWAVLVEGSAEPSDLVRGEATRMAGLLRGAGASVTLRILPGGHDLGLAGEAVGLVASRLSPPGPAR